MQISIILLTYNNIRFVDNFIKSIYGQSFKDFELIIVDNYSTDGTVEKINSLNLKNAKLIQFKNFGNMAASRNLGIRNAKFDYIAFHDSDDFWFNNKLENCVKELNKFDFVYHNMIIKSEESGKKLKSTFRYQINNKIKGHMLEQGNPVATSSVVCCKKIKNNLIQFNENKKFMAIEDFELWLRLSLEGFKFKYIDKNLGYLLERKQSESKIKINKIHGYKLILNKYKKYIPNKTYKRANIYQKYLFANILFLSKKQKSLNFFKFSLIKSEFFRIKYLSFIKIFKILFKIN